MQHPTVYSNCDLKFKESMHREWEFGPFITDLWKSFDFIDEPFDCIHEQLLAIRQFSHGVFLSVKFLLSHSGFLQPTFSKIFT